VNARVPAKGIFYKILILGISLFFIVFEVIKAARAAITIDEVATYLGYISSNVLALFNFGASANNHFLNTLLAKFFYVLGGNHEWVLRIPNLLGYAIYLLFSFLLLDRFIKNKFIVVCGYLLLNVNPYVLDFFALCRGYGLSIGFLMPALFFFVSFLDRTIRLRPGGGRHLQFSLIAAALAVLSYFGLLNVYLSLAAFAFVFLVVVNIQSRRRPPQGEPVQEVPRTKKRIWLPITLAAVLFNLSVIGQDLSLVQNLFEPVTVRMAGLNEEDRQAIRIFRVDAQNLETELSYRDGLWKLAEPVYFSAIKFRCLPAVLNKVQNIEISIGGKTFVYDAADIKRFKNLPHKKFIIFSSSSSTSLQHSMFPMFKPVINWKGDLDYLKVLLMRILLVTGIIALAAALLVGVGRLLRQWKVLTLEQFRPLAWTTLTLGIFLGYPFYILKRTGEFYNGGQTGFIWDTVYSLIYRSFYGQAYFAGQERAVFAFLCLFLLCALIVLFVHIRKKSTAEGLPGLFLPALLFLASAATLAQRALFNTAYLFGRTGLFFIPLFMLFLIFLVSDLARLTKGLKIVSLTFLGMVTALALGHFWLTANTAKMFEWKADADTKSLLADMQEIKDKDAAHPAKIRLGVGAGFNPSIQYYLQRNRWTWLEVNTAPPYEGNDYYYLDEFLDISQIASPPMIVLKRYPWSRNILAKPKTE
jgi:hypothetical protein